ncbi:ricin-type beta-trefoil lectin domain protein [Ktedonobacteria bacterium brp13]|nr:ricin-type beta-trefoil lectin domain protein [Ktedonobacteria bacterium brp13]
MLAKSEKPTVIPNSYIVVLKNKPYAKAAEIKSMAHKLASTYGGTLTNVYTAALQGFSLHISDAQAKKLAKDAQVSYIEQDATMPLMSTSMQSSTTPTTQANAPWSLDRIDQQNLPLSGTYSYNTDGSNVSVYILDTGVRFTHVDFGGRAVSAPDGGDNNDCAGHGTAIAGIIGGTTWGVAKNAKLYSLRNLSCTNVPATSLGMSAIDWVTANAQRPAVVNISWGTNIDPALDASINNSMASGITYVIAAGNNNGDACQTSPQDDTNAIVVGSTGRSDARSPFSNYGPCVTMFAPGEFIPTDSYVSDTATTTATGTSFSAPLVAGAAALYLSAHPTATPSQVKAALLACATSGVITNVGSGSPNKLLSIQCAQSIQVTNPGLLMSTQGQSIHLQLQATDPTPGQSITYSATGLPSGLSLDASTGVISGTYAGTGANPVQVTVSDSSGASGSASFMWNTIKGYGSITDAVKNCIDDAHSLASDGNTIQLYSCNQSQAQNWMLNDNGTITVFGMCMTASNNGTTDGTPIVLYDCSTAPSQIWQPQSNGELLNPASGLCLNEPSTSGGTQLTLATCTGASTQQWTLPGANSPNILAATNPGDQISDKGTAVSLQFRAFDSGVGQTVTYSATGLPAGLSINTSTGLISGTLTNVGSSSVTLTAKDGTGVSTTASFNWSVGNGAITGLSGQCLDDQHTSTTNGNPIDVWGCNQGASQEWTLGAGNTLQVVGKCMTASNNGITVGTPIVLYDCSSAPSQIWQPQSNGELLNPVSGLCLNAPATSSTLTLATCTDSANQQWTLPVADNVTITNPGQQSVVAGTATSLQINAANFNTQQTLSYSATGLPAGLSINASTGLISGTPTTAGSSSVTVTVKDSSGVSATMTFNWDIAKAQGAITGVNGNCIDDSASQSWNGNVIQLYGCNQSPAQTWTLNGNSTISVFGKCMTASNNGTTSGTPIVLYDCSAASSQIWQYQQTNGNLLNPASGLCLNAPSTSGGTQLTLAACAVTVSEAWTVPGEVAPHFITVTNPGSQTTFAAQTASLQITATDSLNGQTLSYSATGLPAGLSINASTGLISGTPTTVGSSSVTITVKDSSGLSATTTFKWNIAGQGVITDATGLCIDDSSSGNWNGNAIQIWGCNQTAAQTWTLNADGTISVFGMCMTASNNGTTSGTPIVLYDCSAASSQIWQYQKTNGNLLNPASGLCLNAPLLTQGTHLTLAACASTAGQEWAAPGEPAPHYITVTNPGSQTTVVAQTASLQIAATDSLNGQTLSYSATGLPAGLSINASTGLISGTPTTVGSSSVTVTVKDSSGVSATTTFNWRIAKGQGVITDTNGLCIDDSSSGNWNGNAIQIWGCNQTQAQNWTLYANGTISTFGMCMTASNNGTTSGTPIVLYDCSAAPSQIWQPQSNGELLNPASGLCLNEQGTGQGTQLTLATCTGTAAQQWKLPITGSIAATPAAVRQSLIA